MKLPAAVPARHVGAATLDKGLALLAKVVRDRGLTPLSTIAAEMGLAPSTARRLVAALDRHGLVARGERGRYLAGGALIELGCMHDRRGLIIGVSRAPLRQLARTLGATTHLGVFETDMVTYIVKESVSAHSVFTRELQQLEAYCSGIGKVLLAHLDERAREDYLEAGSFVALTSRTIIDPARLREELARVFEQGYAIDDGEIAPDLYCLAVPVKDVSGTVFAAISVSYHSGLRNMSLLHVLSRLRASATAISKRLGRFV